MDTCHENVNEMVRDFVCGDDGGLLRGVWRSVSLSEAIASVLACDLAASRQ